MEIKLPDTTAWGKPDWGIRVPARDGFGIDLRDCFIGQAGQVPDEAPAHWGLAQRGSVIDPSTPPFDFPFNKKVEVWTENIADLVEQAKLGQWNAATAISWHDLKPLPADVEQAVCQVCTFMIQNEYLALYLPAKLLTKVDPRFTEVVLFLASQVEDEARHVEVFTKRALANGGGLQYVSAATEWSLKSLLDQEDFTNASFLLHILGEGTFMELLKFLEEVSPDPVTATIFRMARQDEGRHVGYGVSHIAYHLQHDPTLAGTLYQAAEGRAAFLRQAAGASPFVQQALAVLAGGGSSPEHVARGRERVKDLYREMHATRVRRLLQVGFDRAVAERISDLHGGAVPNFM
ncbi:MAG TPA: ferritin-like domain-containing protein [bacterium]|nr:ferritin-like domain-containing protein [bacterium]